MKKIFLSGYRGIGLATIIKELEEKIVKTMTDCKNDDCQGCVYFSQKIDPIIKSYMAEVIGEDEKPKYSERNKVGNWESIEKSRKERNLFRQTMRISAGITDTQGKEEV